MGDRCQVLRVKAEEDKKPPSIEKVLVFTESCKLEVEGPGFHFFPSPTTQLWLPSEMIKTKRISVSGVHFSPRCHSLPFLSCSFSSWESCLLHSFLLARGDSQYTPNIFGSQGKVDGLSTQQEIASYSRPICSSLWLTGERQELVAALKILRRNRSRTWASVGMNLDGVVEIC